MYQGQPWHRYCKTSDNRVIRLIGPNGAYPDVTRLSGISVVKRHVQTVLSLYILQAGSTGVDGRNPIRNNWVIGSAGQAGYTHREIV